MRKKILFLLLFHIVRIHPIFSIGQVHERIYLQTDKQFYLAGEQIWLKVFTVTPQKVPLSISKIAYIELLDEERPREQIKIELNSGTGEGWMQLPQGLESGYYRLIAYTRFMKNEGEKVFFEKKIGVINISQSEKTERIYFGKFPSQIEKQVRNTFTLSTDKPFYPVRSHGNLLLKDLPEDIHTLSVSITGKDLFLGQEEGNILNWNMPLETSFQEEETLLPEFESHIITGQIIGGENNEPVDNLIPMLSFPGGQMNFFIGQINQNNVTFYPSCISGTNEIATTIINAGEAYRLDIQSPFWKKHTPKKISVLQVDTTYLDFLIKRSISLQVSHFFIRDSTRHQKFFDTFFKIKPDQTYILDEYTRFPTMGEVFTEYVAGARFRKNNESWKMSMFLKNEGIYKDPLVLLGGIPVLDYNIIYNYNPLNVSKIELFQESFFIGGYKFDGIIHFTTYRNNYPGFIPDKVTQIVGYEGTQPLRRFVSPSYHDANDDQNSKPDYRHTLLWLPEVDIHETSVEIPFYTSDFTGDFQVIVEGLTRDGKIIFSKSFFTVELKFK